MRPAFQFLNRFQVRVTVAMILSMIFVITLSSLLIYQFALNSQFHSIRQRLMLLAQMASLMIDADTLLKIPLNHDGVYTVEYHSILETLKKIKGVDPQIRYLYTLRKTDREGILQFVVDADPVLMNKRLQTQTAYPGDQYNAFRFPEMIRAFQWPSADTHLEIDEWGVTLSGYAPLRTRDGKTAAIVGVDILADDVYQMQKEVHQRALLVLLLGLILSIILGMIVSQHMTGPVAKLAEGTRRIARGDLKYRVSIKGNDEINELGQSFNDMAGSLYQSRKKIVGYLFSVVKTLVRILELRDHYTRGHSAAVAVYAGKIAEKLGYSKETIKLFRRMTLLHDIGKLGVKDSLLHKKGPLTEEEWEIIKRHTVIGEDILKPVLAKEEMLAIVRGHHERFDGKGYPDQLRGDEINIFAAIVAVADAYHAMTSNRSYRMAMNKKQAIEEIKKNRGTQFHPKVVDAFLEIIQQENKS